MINLLLLLRRNSVNIFIKVDIVKRLIVDTESVILDAGEQDELLLISDSEIRDRFGRNGETIQKLIRLNIPNFHIFLAHSENVFCVQLAELHVSD